MIKQNLFVTKSLVVLAVIGWWVCPVSALDILYDFEDQTNTFDVVDARDFDGSQNGQTAQTAGNVGNGPTYGPADGVNGSGGLDFIDIQPPSATTNVLETHVVIDFTTSMSFSIDIKPSVVADPNTNNLLWTGRDRGPGETCFGITPSGRLKFYMLGLSPGAVYHSSGSNLIQVNQYQTVGFTLGALPGDDPGVDGRTLTFYLDGAPIDSFSGIGIQATLPNNGNADGTSPVQVGWAEEIGGAEQTQYTGLVDNVFISDRRLTDAEMAALPDAVVVNCGDAGTEYHPYDLDENCYVGLGDFALIAAKWMLCNDPRDLSCTE